MSMHLEFEPHSWYYGFAIKKEYLIADPESRQIAWLGFIDDGNTYSIVELEADTLRNLKQQIRGYWLRDGGKHIPAYYSKRLLKGVKS